MEISENFISLDVVAGINGEGSKRGKKIKKCTDIPSVYRSGANEQVYVSAVADRVNVGKDEGLRFSGWTELGEDEEGDERARRICIAGTGISFEGGGGKNFAPIACPPVDASARARARCSVYLCDTLRIRVNDT